MCRAESKRAWFHVGNCWLEKYHNVSGRDESQLGLVSLTVAKQIRMEDTARFWLLSAILGASTIPFPPSSRPEHFPRAAGFSPGGTARFPFSSWRKAKTAARITQTYGNKTIEIRDRRREATVGRLRKVGERDERNPRRGTSVDGSRARRRKDNGGKNQRANGALFTNSSGRMQRRKSDGTKAEGNAQFLRANGRRCFSNNAKGPPPRQM